MFNKNIIKKDIIKIVLLMLVFSFNSAFSEFDYNTFLTSTKDIRRMDNFGTDFYLTVPPAFFKENQNNISIKVFVFSHNNATVKLNVAAKAFSETAFINANTEKVFDILPEIAFPFTTASTLPINNEELYKKSALRISADYPIAVYVLVTGNLQCEGFMGIPVSSSGKEYFLQSFIDPTSQITSPINFPAIAGIVNPFDGNKITIILGNNLAGKIFPKDTITRVLEQGDTWFIALKGKTGDLSGIKVISDKPISVITANQQATVPVGTNPSNYLIEQELPTNIWGRYYHISRLISREMNPVIKVLAKEPDTEVYLNGQIVSTLISTSNQNNFLEIKPNVTNPTALEVITSNKPISVAVYHPGYGDEKTNVDFYKPSRTNLIPNEQYAGSLLFNLPQNIIETEKTECYLYLIAQLSNDGTIPDDLEIGNYVNNTIVWKKINKIQISDLKEFKYQFNGKRFAQIAIRLNQSGNYKLKGNAGFAAYLFGSNQQGTFTFPAGLPCQNLVSGDNLPPVPSQIQLCDGSVNGKVTDMPSDPEIRANLSSPIYHSNLSNNYEFTTESIVPGITSSFNWTLRVRDKNYDANAIVTFRDYAGNDTTISVIYKSPKIIIEPTIVNFGNTKIGIETSQFITIKNNSDSTYKIKDILFKYNDIGFKLKNNFQSKILTPGEQDVVEISFISSKTGSFEDSVGVNNDCFTAYKAKLIARTGSPKIMVTDVFFNDLTVPNSETKYASITNVGEDDLKINGWTLSDNTNFSVGFGREISQSNPLIIEPSKNFTFQVSFIPKSEKIYNERLTFNSNAAEIDSISLLRAKAILPGLITSSYDWQSVRLDTSVVPKEFPVKNAIILKNTGKSDITITKVSIEPGSKNSDNFEINFNQLMGKTLRPNDIFELQATLIPKNIGISELILKFETNLNTENYSKLSATVVVPKLSINSNLVDFDTTLVNYPAQENSRLIEIKNLSKIEWEFADTLSIFEIKTTDEGKVQLDDDDGTGSFTIHTSKWNFPIELLPGEKLSIPATFSAKDTGIIQSKILIKSNALIDTEIQLRGFGANRLLSLTNLELTSCIGLPTEGFCTIRNNSVQAVEIEKVYFDSPDDDFVIMDDMSYGLTILPSESKKIRILYKPSGLSSKSVKVLGKVKGELIPSLSSIISGKTKQNKLQSYLSPVSQTAEIDKDIKTKIYFEDITSEANSICNKFFVNINYDASFLKINPNSISLGKTLAGKFKIENLKINQSKGEAKFELINLQNEYLISQGEFLTMEFHTYLPAAEKSDGKISAVIIPDNNSCIVIQTSSGNVVLNNACTEDKRRIKISENDYYIHGLEQNIISKDFEIKFGIVFDSHTEVSIYNSFGNLVARPFYGSLTKGNYSFNFDITNLSNGLYFILLKSSEYCEVKKFIIEK